MPRRPSTANLLEAWRQAERASEAALRSAQSAAEVLKHTEATVVAARQALIDAGVALEATEQTTADAREMYAERQQDVADETAAEDHIRHIARRASYG